MAIGTSGGSGGGGGGMFDSFTNLGDKIFNNVMSAIDTFGTMNEKKAIVPRQMRKLDAESEILELQAKDLKKKQAWDSNFKRYMLGGR
jgi:cell division protein FtsB